MQILRSLPQYSRLVDTHAGFMPWVLAQGIKNARAKLTDVLLWWCDRNCPGCGGVKLGKMAICETCKGFGTREAPHEAEGLLISEHIGEHVGPRPLWHHRRAEADEGPEGGCSPGGESGKTLKRWGNITRP